MTTRTVFVDIEESDIHGKLPANDVLVDDAGRRYIVAGQPQGIVYHYATLAAAILATASLTNGQYVFIEGGQDVGALPNDDRGVWHVDAAQGAARANYTKVLDINNKASESYVDDTAGFFVATNVEAALAEIGTKQVFYKLGGIASASVRGTSSTAFDALISALVIDKGSATDATGAGSATVPGVLLNNVYAYQIPLRGAVTRDVIDDGFGNEVYGRLTQVSGNYVMSFYSFKAGVQTAYSFAGAAATGIIDLAANPADGDTVVISDGVGPAITFEFDSNASVVETATLRQVVIGATAADTITALVAAITASASVVTAVDGTGDTVDLTNAIGLAGNIALTKTGADITVTGMTGGTGTAIEAAYVLVSQDFMNLPAYAGVVQGEFWGDQAGAVGTVADTQVTTAGPFTGLLTGQTTQAGVNNKVDQLGLATTGNGASLIAIEDFGNYLAATNVEAALQELAGLIGAKIKDYANLAAAIAAAGVTPFAVGTYVIIAGAGADAAERGIWKVTAGTGTLAGNYTKVLDISHTASEVLIVDAGSKFGGTSVEAALDELIGAIGGASTTVRDYSSNTYVADNDNIVTAIGKLDAGLTALITKALISKDFIANEAIAAATSGPQLVSQDGTLFRVNLAVAGAIGPKVEVVGFATGDDYATNDAINQGTQGTVMAGFCTGFSSLAPGVMYYADPTTPGGITSTIPSTVGQWIIPVGVAVGPTTLLVRLGEPQEIVPSLPALQRAIHFKSTAGVSGGLGELNYAVAVGDLWIDNDATKQNPTKSAVGRYTVHVCKQAWTGGGSDLSAGQVNTYFQVVGKQN